MNHIDVAEIKTQYGYYENYWTVDGVALPNLLDLKSKDIDDDFVQSDIKSFLGLCPAWNLDLEWRGDYPMSRKCGKDLAHILRMILSSILIMACLQIIL